MTGETLSTRALNRALLARQLLLERSSLSVPDAVEQVGGLQTQYAPSGYVGLWSRLAELSPASMFVWGRHDVLVPTAFRKHVERVLPAARHVELDCGHVPQVERPRETHAAIRTFLAGSR